MTRLILLAFALYSLNNAVFPNIEQAESRPINTKQKMEDVHSSTWLGGARGIELETEKKDEKIKHDLAKQKMLYENEEYYRRGL